MHVEPKIYLISRPILDDTAIGEFLSDIGADEFNFDPDSWNSATDLTEVAGRVCYRSWQPGLNPNVTKVRNSADYIENIIKSRHGNVMEHAEFSFIFYNVSRIFTHELIRHRAGTAVSQESLRFVRINEIPMWQNDWALNDSELQEYASRVLWNLELFQEWMADHFNLDNISFNEKKKYTSYMRRWLPEGIGTTLVWTCNMRELRHVIEARTDIHAEEEIRLVFDKVASILVDEVPKLMSDFVRDDLGQWKPKYSKI